MTRFCLGLKLIEWRLVGSLFVMLLWCRRREVDRRGDFEFSFSLLFCFVLGFEIYKWDLCNQWFVLRKVFFFLFVQNFRKDRNL